MLPDGGPPIRADVVWRAQRLIVQLDGHSTHRTRQAFEQNCRRDQRLTIAGWRPIRSTWRQLECEPGQVAATVLELLKR